MYLPKIRKLLTAEELSIFYNHLTRLTYRRGQILIKQGTVANRMYLVEHGYCRSYVNRDGEEITDFFFFEKSFATDFASFCSDKPSLLNLVCAEDCTLLEITKTKLEILYKKYHSFSEIGRLMAESAFVQLEERVRLLHTEDLKTKYQFMIQNFPDVFQRVPQYQIASYLGVKPQSLSRMRAKLSGKEY